MIITWKNQEGTFNTKPCARKISFTGTAARWLLYCIQSNGGSFVDAIIGKYNAEIKKPERSGKTRIHICRRWHEDMDLTIPYTIPETMREEDQTCLCKMGSSRLGYTVVDYIEGMNGTTKYSDSGEK